MNHILIQPQNLSSNNFQLLKTLSTFWKENGWYDDGTNSFSSEAMIKILGKLVEVNDTDSEHGDLLISTLKVICNSNQNSKNKLKITSVSFIGDKNFKFLLTSEGNENSFLFFLKHYFEVENLPPKESLSRLHLIKKLVGPLKELNIEVEFSEALEQREISRVVKAFPVLESSGSGESLRYSLNYKLLLDSGETHAVANSEFASDRGYLKIGNKYVLFDDDMYPAISRQKMLTNLDSTEASAVFTNPTEALFPAGTDTEKFDMSEYDIRVAAFEYAPKIKFKEVISSNISWYESDDGRIPCIQFKNSDGEIVSVAITDDIVNELIPKMETSINSGILLADGNPRPVSDKAGNLISSSESNLNLLRTIKELILADKKHEDKKPAVQNKGTKVAVLREVSLPILEQNIDRIKMTKDDFEALLNQEIKMKPHQIDGVNWLLNAYFAKRGGIFLCDDMGLGKTLQLILFFTILQHIDKFAKLKHLTKHITQDKSSLVVAPLILINNWEAEIKKFVKPEYLFSVYKLHGSNLDSVKNSDGSLYKNWWKNYKLILTNYSTFARYQVDLLKYPFLVTFFDESQNLKNPDIAASKAARGLNSEFVVCATGTPVEIRYLDLWSQMDSLKRRPSHPLGKEDEFVQNYEKSTNGSTKLREIIKLNEDDGLMIRRDKSLLRAAGELPERVINEPHFVQMTAFQETQEEFIVKKFKGNSLKILQNLQKLYQHPYLLSPNDFNSSVTSIINDSPKLQKTLEVLNEIKNANEKVLVFTLWTGMQSLLQRVFKEVYGIDVDVINGDVNAKAKNSKKSSAMDIIERFSEKDGFNILILSPLAAGAGLNITAANHVIHYGRWWNPAKEDQSTDRAYRIGQKKTVYVHYPVLVSSKGEGFDKKLDQRVRDRRKMAYDVLTPINKFDVDTEFSTDQDEVKK